MKAGRELDALIDEKIFEQEGTDNEYSTRIEDAWQVVERHQSAEIEHDYGGSTIVVLNKAAAGWFSAHADTAPLAICLAALKAVGIRRE